MQKEMFDYLIVGCGFSGITLAERIASELDKKVLIVEKRSHIGGISFDCRDENGIMVSKYGAHIFHTNLENVHDYVDRFCTLSNYVHRVDAFVGGKYFPLPINLDTINSFFGKKLTPDELPGFLGTIRDQIDNPQNAEEAVVSRVGWELYEAFYRNYTIKQWGIDPRDLEPSVTARLPIRIDRDKRYFSDRWQGIPQEGFTKMFERMLDHKNIHVLLDTDYKTVVDIVKFDKLIYTGPIDCYFDYTYGKLPYRSIDFRFETFDKEHFQHMAVINYPNDHDFTRCVEYKWLYQQISEKTTISREYPCWNNDEPYYPVPSSENGKLYERYGDAAKRLTSVYFCGRLGTYQYLNMDQCISQALLLFKKIADKTI